MVDRDPRRFDAPDRFLINRPPGKNLAFGHGIHFCLWAPTSRVRRCARQLAGTISNLDRLELTDAPLNVIQRDCSTGGNGSKRVWYVSAGETTVERRNLTMLTASMLLDPVVLQHLHRFYATLREQAPVWRQPGTDVVTISMFDLFVGGRGTARGLLLHHGSVCSTAMGMAYLPALSFCGAAMPRLAASDLPVHTSHRRAVFPESVARRMRDAEYEIRVLSECAVTGPNDDRFDFMATIGNGRVNHGRGQADRLSGSRPHAATGSGVRLHHDGWRDDVNR